MKMGKSNRRYVLSFVLSIFVYFSCCPQWLLAQEPDQTPVSPSPNQAVVDEINAIRQQLGGGIAEQLKGLGQSSSLDEQLKRDFDQALKRRLAEESQRALVPKTTAGLDSQHGKYELNRLDPLGRSKLRNNENGGLEMRNRDAYGHRNRQANQPDRVSSPGVPDPRQSVGNQGIRPASDSMRMTGFSASTKPLRGAARRLEQIAADLEEAGLYGDADLIREQARQFWLKSR